MYLGSGPPWSTSLPLPSENAETSSICDLEIFSFPRVSKRARLRDFTIPPKHDTELLQLTVWTKFRFVPRFEQNGTPNEIKLLWMKRNRWTNGVERNATALKEQLQFGRSSISFRVQSGSVQPRFEKINALEKINARSSCIFIGMVSMLEVSEGIM